MKLKFILYLPMSVVVVVELCGVEASKNTILFSILSILPPSSNLVNPSQVFNEKTAPMCVNSSSVWGACSINFLLFG